MNSVEKLHDTLRKHGLKVTSAREAVFLALMNSPSPLSNSELIRNLRNVDKVSVYRTLALYESIGITHRIWNGFKSKVELSEELSPHHHHFTCTGCGTVSSFKSDSIEKALKTTQAYLNVTIAQHIIELSGTCSACKAKT